MSDTSLQPIFAAVVGFGKLGLLHAAIINKVPGCRLRAVVDSSKLVLSALRSANPELQVYSDFEELLSKESPNAIFIATPPKSHIELAALAINREIPTFIEKPLARNAQEAEQLARTVRERGVVTRVGYMNRFIDTFRFAKQIVDSGCLGKLHTMRSTIYVGQLFDRGSGWRYSKDVAGGGVLLSQCSHLLDLITWIFGPVAEVSAHSNKLYSAEVEDEMHFYLYFRNSLRGWVDSSWSVRHYRTLTLEVRVEAENGSLSFNEDEASLFLDAAAGGFSTGWTKRRKPDLYNPVGFDVGGPYYTRQTEDFINAVRGNAQPDGGADFESAFQLQRLIDTIYLSCEKRGAPLSV